MRLSWEPFHWVKVKKECMRLTMHPIICTSQFAVHFDPLTFPCFFLLDPPMVRHMHKHMTSLDLMELSKGSWRRSTQRGQTKTPWVGTKKQGLVPQPSRKEVANWVVHAFVAITAPHTSQVG